MTSQKIIYDLKHISLESIQPDEALYLYALTKMIRPRTIVELGCGQKMFSSRNFLAAIQDIYQSKLFTIDIVDQKSLGDQHTHVKKQVKDVTSSDIDNRTIHLLFVDTHNYLQQLDFINNFKRIGIIDNNTIIALHDTGNDADGNSHQVAERMLVHELKSMGYDLISLNCDFERGFFRKGISIAQPFKNMKIYP